MIKLAELPVPSTSFTADTRLQDPDAVSGALTLRFSFRFNGVPSTSDLSFVGARAHRHRAESACTPWHNNEPYDALVEVQDSDWLNEIVGLSIMNGYPDAEHLRHFAIYVDSDGCFEVIAKGWELTPPVPVALARRGGISGPPTGVTPNVSLWSPTHE